MRAMQNETNLPPDIRLSSLSHGGGCGCKMSPAVLQGIMASMPAGVLPPQLLVGTESSDDAAVYQINATQALVATTDFLLRLSMIRSISVVLQQPMRYRISMPWGRSRCWRWP